LEGVPAGTPFSCAHPSKPNIQLAKNLQERYKAHIQKSSTAEVLLGGNQGDFQ
jgi:hypothetical protein